MRYPKYTYGLLAFLPAMLLPVVFYAQVAGVGKPLKAVNEIAITQKLRVVMDEEYRRTLTTNETLPLTAGYTIQKSFCIDDAISGTSITDSTIYISKVLIINPNQAGIALYFSKFEISSQTKAYVYSADFEDIIELYPSSSGQKNTAVRPVFADSIYLQIEWHAKDTDLPLICLSEIGFVFYDNYARNFGSSGDCNVNVNCTEGSSWQNQKNGITRILVKQGSGLYWCSGSLINNVRMDKTPYVFTANHCGVSSSSADYAQWVFYFNYESDECMNPAQEPFFQNITGSQLISASRNSVENGSDFKLLLLNQTVPESFKPYFNGWSKNNSATETGSGIHHPSGDIKKISTFSTTPLSVAFGQQNPEQQEKYWRVFWAETTNGHGVTEGGSSGSPLFDSNGRIIGALTGGSSSCDNKLEPDFYGKFSYSWESNGSTADLQLAPWLDPDNTGLNTLNGIGSDVDPLRALFSVDYGEIAPGQLVEFTSLSSGNILTFEWLFPGGFPDKSIEESPGKIMYEAFGAYDVSLVVGDGSRMDTLTRKAFVKVMPFISPNPTGNTFTIQTGSVVADLFQISIFDLSGREIGFRRQLIDSGKITITLDQPVKGLLILLLRTDKETIPVKLIVTD